MVRPRFGNKFLCSDLRVILTIRKKLPKGVALETGDDCLNMTEKIYKRSAHYLNNVPSTYCIPECTSIVQYHSHLYIFYTVVLLDLAAHT